MFISVFFFVRKHAISYLHFTVKLIFLILRMSAQVAKIKAMAQKGINVMRLFLSFLCFFVCQVFFVF